MCIRWIRSPGFHIARAAALLFFALAMLGQNNAWAQYFAPPYLAFTGSAESADGCLGAIDGGGYYRGYISAQLHQADGGAIYAGRFDAVSSWSPLRESNSLSRNSAVRLRSDGSPDPNWSLDIRCDASTKLTSISALAMDSAGNVYVGGLFTVPGTDQRQNLARFSADGKLDTAWQMNANGEIFALAVDEDDNLFVGEGLRRSAAWRGRIWPRSPKARSSPSGTP